MTKRTKSEMLDTLKADDEDIILNLGDMQIISIKDIDTKYGEKTVITLEEVNSDKKVQVFVNAVSMNNLIDAYGEEDKKYIGKNVKLTIEIDEKFNKKMIVIHAVK
jgi:hypothetical protein